jgi:hypothetical protein
MAAGKQSSSRQLLALHYQHRMPKALRAPCMACCTHHIVLIKVSITVAGIREAANVCQANHNVALLLLFFNSASRASLKCLVRCFRFKKKTKAWLPCETQRHRAHSSSTVFREHPGSGVLLMITRLYVIPYEQEACKQLR